MTVDEWFNTPVPWVMAIMFFAIMFVGYMLERTERLREQQERRIAERRERLARRLYKSRKELK